VFGSRGLGQQMLRLSAMETEGIQSQIGQGPTVSEKEVIAGKLISG